MYQNVLLLEKLKYMLSYCSELLRMFSSFFILNINVQYLLCASSGVTDLQRYLSFQFLGVARQSYQLLSLVAPGWLQLPLLISVYVCYCFLC